MQWPNEQKPLDQSSTFKEIYSSFSKQLPKEFEEIVSWVANQDGDLLQLEEEVTNVIGKNNSSYLIEDKYLFTTWICAEALYLAPTLNTWKKIKSFLYHSSVIEHDLPSVMRSLAESKAEILKAYMLLAKEAFSALDNDTLKSNSSHSNEERSNYLLHWENNNNKLEELWWGLRHWNEMNYWDEYSLLHFFSELEPNELMTTLSQSKNPYLLQSLFVMIDAGGNFSQFHMWGKCIAAAPVAFEDDGSWNGSVIAPLLLVEAVSRLLNSEQDTLYSGNLTEVEILKKDISSIAKNIVDVVSKRKDALALFSRWTTWLMRQDLSYSPNDNTKAKPFVIDILIDAIGSKLKNKTVIQKTSSDAGLWEPWCYQCVLAYYASNGFIDPPVNQLFIDEWNISIDDWCGDKGELLRQHASLLITFSKDTPGMAANLLAYPIAQAELPTDVWINIWNNIYALREIVEYGDGSSEEYQSQTEASNLLFLMFRIGLAIFDQRAEQCKAISSSISREQVMLFDKLSSASREMREIDSTLNYDAWKNASLHLSIRRCIWEQQFSKPLQENIPCIFSEKDTPTIQAHLLNAKSDVMELLQLLQSILMNDIDITKLQVELDSASININNVLDEAKQLNQYNERKYPVDQEQLKIIESMLVKAV